MSPLEALYGYTPKHVALDYRPTGEPTDVNQRVEQLREMHHWLAERMGTVQATRNELTNQRRPLPVFERGDLVMFQLHVRTKLQAKWAGPAMVLKRINAVDYLLEMPEGHERKHAVIHVLYLRRWKSIGQQAEITEERPNTSTMSPTRSSIANQ
jgi:hypothetical protein